MCKNEFKIYVRSMSLYNYSENKMYNYSELNIIYPVKCFETYDIALEWLLKNGISITNGFYEKYEQGCAFMIIENPKTDENNFYDFFEWCDTYMSNTWLNLTITHYVFSEESYKMCLDEHLRYLYNDWAYIFPAWICRAYINEYCFGCDIDHYKKTYMFIHGETPSMNKINILKKYLEETEKNKQNLLEKTFIKELESSD